jgi:S1-C subfamily serine protease
MLVFVQASWRRLGLLAALLVSCAGCSAPAWRAPTSQERAHSLQSLNLPAAAQEELVQRALAGTACLLALENIHWSNPDAKGSRSFSANAARGAGVFVTEDGYCLTAAHCLSASGLELVSYTKQQKQNGQIARRVWVGNAKDPSTDVALVKIEESGLDAFAWAGDHDIRIDGAILLAGSSVCVNGTPLTVGAGRITCCEMARQERDGYSTRVIQIDGPIGRGDSGGAVTTSDGRLIGIAVRGRFGLFY